MSDRLFKPSAVHKLEDPERLVWLPPNEVLTALSLRPGMNVADIGAGTGYFALPIASAILPGGKVFAVDLQTEMLDLLRAKLAGSAPQNIELLEGSANATHLAKASVEVVLSANVWHELDDHSAAVQEVRRILAPGGQLAILDWRTDVIQPPGPPLQHRTAAEDVRVFLLKAGWRCGPVHYIGPYNYLILCSPVAD